MKPVLKQNSQKLSVVQGGLSGYRLATDENGEVFYRQAVSYMKDTLGSQGVQKLIQKFQEKRIAWKMQRRPERRQRKTNP